MSSNVYSHGTFYALYDNVEEQYEEIQEWLYENHPKFQINYEGTLAYTDCGGLESYGVVFHKNSSHNDLETIHDINKSGILRIDPYKYIKYSCIWYNGADSDMSMTTLEEFNKALGVKNGRY